MDYKKLGIEERFVLENGAIVEKAKADPNAPKFPESFPKEHMKLVEDSIHLANMLHSFAEDYKKLQEEQRARTKEIMRLTNERERS